MRFPAVVNKDYSVVPWKEWWQRLPKNMTVKQVDAAKAFYQDQMIKKRPPLMRAPLKYQDDLEMVKQNKCYVVENNAENYARWIEVLSMYRYYWKHASERPEDINPMFLSMTKGGDKFVGDQYLENYLRDGPTIKEMILCGYTLEKYAYEKRYADDNVGELLAGMRKQTMLARRHADALIDMYYKTLKLIVPQKWITLLQMQIFNLQNLKVGKSKLTYCRYQYQIFCKTMDIDMVKVPKWQTLSIIIEYTIKTNPNVPYEQFWETVYDIYGARTEESQLKLLEKYGTKDAYERKSKTGAYAAFIPKEERLVAYRKVKGDIDAW